MDEEQLVVQIGESEEKLNMLEYKQLQQDLIALGYSKDEVCRGMFDEDPSSDNLSAIGTGERITGTVL